jgi:hypothetical protein
LIGSWWPVGAPLSVIYPSSYELVSTYQSPHPRRSPSRSRASARPPTRGHGIAAFSNNNTHNTTRASYKTLLVQDKVLVGRYW